MKQIRITTRSTGPILAELSNCCPRTVNAIWEALPLEAKVNTWGDEIYFSIPVEAEDENTKEVVDIGDIGYWPPGNAFCIFFGPTPVSRGDEIRPASPVNVFGRIIDDPKVFRKVGVGEILRVERT